MEGKKGITSVDSLVNEAFLLLEDITVHFHTECSERKIEINGKDYFFNPIFKKNLDSNTSLEFKNRSRNTFVPSILELKWYYAASWSSLVAQQ